MEKFKKVSEPIETDFYSIYRNKKGEKEIHINGYTYYGDQFEVVDVCWFIEPLKEFVKHIADNDDYVDEMLGEHKQYHLDMTDEEGVSAINEYFNGNPADYVLHYTEITEDTPCGNFITSY